MNYCFPKQKHHILWIPSNIILTLLTLLTLISATNAEIIPDTDNFSTNTNVTNGVIQGGIRVGNSLLHSFDEFSIPTNSQAVFKLNTPNLDIETIISRVTGDKISLIDGIIGADGTANLVLINPNGIIFGANAQLNIGGSFLASTANSVIFPDGSEFSTTNPQSPPLLTINVPIGLQFGSNPSPIIHQTNSNLSVNPGQTLALVGGNLSLNGANITAAQGRIELGSVASSGRVNLTPITTGFALDYSDIQQFGNIDLSNATAVNTSDLGAGGGGKIRVQGGQVTLTQGSNLVAETFGDINGGGIDIQANQVKLQQGAFASTSTFGTGAGGDLTIQANRVDVIGTTPSQLAQQLLSGTFDPFNLSNGLFSFSGGEGNAGHLTLETNQLIVQNGATLLTTAFAEGNGGDLILNVSEFADLTRGSLLLTGTTAKGNAGDFQITANQLRVLEGTSLSTTPSAMSQGQGGNLTVTAEFVELRGTPANAVVPGGLFTTTLGAGDAGDFILNTGQLIVADGSQISAAAAGGGRGGNLRVNADTVELRGVSADGQFLSGLFTSSSLLTVAGQRGTAPAGDLMINTRRLSVRDGAQISAATGSAGTAGSLNINASESVTVAGGATGVAPAVERVSFGIIGDGIVPSAIEANTSGAGGAGDLQIQTGQLNVWDGAEVGVRGTASGAAGNLDITADSIWLDNQGGISAATVAGTGGNIRLEASNVLLRRNSRITTNTENSDGGNITIDTNTLVAIDNSDITANARQGRGGRVSITAQGIFGIQFRDELTPDSDITATSDLGPEFNGLVTLNIQGIDPNRGLVQLPENFTQPSNQIATGCVAETGNSFVMTGRGGLPEDPSQILRGRTLWQDLRSLNLDEENLGETGPAENRQQFPSTREEIHPEKNLISHHSSIVEAQGWVIDADGNVELVADMPNNRLRRLESSRTSHCY
ncbi:two-partner secretion domain-containing protein [Coleofasciculus sp. G2-EDA-02]|uniref:two-partner secretion domain-containing protein n=1 Tax=Coleofasciculus sp. G2-EDA-02 TaxID=3069529 RepID=UPI0032F2FEFE